jgi:hypothetical protein
MQTYPLCVAQKTCERWSLIKKNRYLLIGAWRFYKMLLWRKRSKNEQREGNHSGQANSISTYIISGLLPLFPWRIFLFGVSFLQKASLPTAHWAYFLLWLACVSYVCTVVGTVCRRHCRVTGNCWLEERQTDDRANMHIQATAGLSVPTQCSMWMVGKAKARFECFFLQ